MKLMCENNALDAKEHALEAKDPETRRTWELIADRWRDLAALFPEQCFCGRIAAGAQQYRDGKRIVLCSRHLHMALMRGMRVKVGVTSDS